MGQEMVQPVHYFQLQGGSAFCKDGNQETLEDSQIWDFVGGHRRNH